MKALQEKHARAIELRKMGWSYPEIKNELGVSKGSLSLWLRNYPLTPDQLSKYKNDRESRRVENYRNTCERTRQTKLDGYYDQERVRLLPLSKSEMYLAGLMLYWGEGLKANWSTVSFSNTNPKMIVFVKKWLTDCLGVSVDKLVVRLHLYSDMDSSTEHGYWGKLLEIPLRQFRKPYVKQSMRIGISEKGGFGHGTCDLTVHNAVLKKRIIMGIKVISDFSS